MDNLETLSHRLVVPGEANHYGTLYAGSLLRMALEAGYAAAFRLIGNQANLVLRRVLNLECYYPVPVGKLIEIRGRPLLVRQAYMVVGLIGTPLESHPGPWMDGLMVFVQVDENTRPASFPDRMHLDPPVDDTWTPLYERMLELIRLSRPAAVPSV